MEAKDQREQVYAIVRVDGDLAEVTNVEYRIAVKEVVRDLGIAEEEVRRLNELNGSKGYHYFWTTTRLFGSGESFGTHTAK